MKITVLSLFDGISCGQLALHKIGITNYTYYASEIDHKAIQVTQKHFPETIQLGDIKKINFKALPKIDLLLGGSPCQGFSFAGKQKCFKDERSKLILYFFKALRILEPKFFLLENVVMKKESQDIISDCLDVKPIKINSALFSAQNRNRLYWTNIKLPELTNIVDKNLFLADIVDETLKDVTSRFNKKIEGTLSYSKAQSSVRMLNQKSKCLLVGGQNISNSGATNVKIKDRIYQLQPIHCERLQTIPDDYTFGSSNTQRYKMIGNSWTVDVIVHILNFIHKGEIL